MRDSKRSAAIFTPLRSVSMRTSVSGNSRTSSNSFLAGSVSVPPLLTDAGALRPEAHVEIRRHHPHRVAIGFDQHVGQNGDRDLPFDDVLEK